MGVTERQLPTLLQLDGLELDQQAESLIDKRFHEVQELMPLTLRNLGDGAKSLFLQYARQSWPTSHRRHWIDADAFCCYLHDRRLGEVHRGEWNWIHFVGNGRRLSISLIGSLSRPIVQLLYRRQGRPCMTRWPKSLLY